MRFMFLIVFLCACSGQVPGKFAAEEFSSEDTSDFVALDEIDTTPEFSFDDSQTTWDMDGEELPENEEDISRKDIDNGRDTSTDSTDDTDTVDSDSDDAGIRIDTDTEENGIYDAGVVVDSGTSVDSGNDSGSDANLPDDTDSETDTDVDTGTDFETDTESDTDTESETEVDTETDTGSDTEIPCPLNDTLFGGDLEVCWYLGWEGKSCEEVCAPWGDYSMRTRDYVGSGGTNNQCRDVLDYFAATGEDGVSQLWDPPLGCGFDSLNLRKVRYAQLTANDSSDDNFRRLCACTVY